jgi:SAM-dependent methyltransferase
MTKEELMRRGLDKARMVGVEIGPFYSPIAPKSDGWQTTVVDFMDEHQLRSLAERHNSPTIRERVVVDIIWRGQPLAELCLQRRPAGYDFLIASHAIEHIPDLIGFLQQASRLLTVGGVISLAVPDSRFCFDYFKPLSSTASLLAAHQEHRELHAPESIFEAFGYSALINGQGMWNRYERRQPIIAGNLSHAYAKYRSYVEKIAQGTQEYLDVHCWKFVPASFELALLELNALGLTDWSVAELTETAGAEFIVRLIRKKVSLSDAELQQSRNRLLHKIVEQFAHRRQPKFLVMARLLRNKLKRLRPLDQLSVNNNPMS